MFETIFVVTLFIIYLSLWKIKQLNQKKNTGINPSVMGKSTSNIQRYMNQLTIFLTMYIVIIIVLHSTQLQIGTFLYRIEALDYISIDIIGFLIGLIGLSFCLYAQIKMSGSWRVGIDENVKTDLITTGLYKYIRNPTYLGLFLLNIGIWLIWPTWAVFFFTFTFALFLDIQVRCEEDYLTSIHGKRYIEYKNSTKRYIPFVY